MLDRERVLAKLDQLERYLRELRQIAPTSFEEFGTIEKKRACERLLQISVECVIDTCSLIVARLRLGLPAEEDDLFEKLEQAGIISNSMRILLQRMKGFRNILVHEYGEIEDPIVFDILQNQLGDFDEFRKEITQALK
jgi:uncharacterized protein YutE (UPF0331/DUF86 family)